MSASPGMCRIDDADDRFQWAARAFEEQRAEDLPEARRLLRELLRESFVRDGVREDIRHRVSLEDVERVEGLSAQAAAAELGISPRAVQRNRAKHRRGAA